MNYLLWHDDSKRSPADKIAIAVRDFTERCGKAPTVILVNERDMCLDIPGVRLGTDEKVVVRPGEFWLGPAENEHVI